jgi:NAD(P)-dependent dehydrogenase (short-subunit alcohol dehydrogenase family)
MSTAIMAVCLKEIEMDEGEFTGRVALVTGGSSGIGRAVVERLANAGASVVLGANESSVHTSEAHLRSAGLEVSAVRADVAVAAEAYGLVAFGVERYGGLDVVVNSAGVQRYGTVEETSEAEWDRVLDVNLKGIFLVCKAAVPELRRRGGGAIVNVSSVQATATQAGVAAYTASKGGILALTRAMAVDHAPDGIRVTAVSPGSVDTPMLRLAADQFRGERSVDELVAEWGRSHPLGRVAAAAEVAELVAFLASPRAAFVTGSEHRIDGGLLASLPVALPERRSRRQ